MTDDCYALPPLEITEEEERIFDDGEALILALATLKIRVAPEVLEDYLEYLEVTEVQKPALMDFALRRHVLVRDEDGESARIPTPRMLGAMLLTRAELCGARVRDREKQVLRFRFGLEDGTPHSLDETGLHFGIGRERVRRMECRLFRGSARAGLRAEHRRNFFI